MEASRHSRSYVRGPFNMTQIFDLYVAIPGGVGWAPVEHMGNLLGGYLGVDPIMVNAKASLSKLTKILGTLPRPSSQQKVAIVIASDPGQLNAIAQARYLARRYSAVYGWVIDSFWDDRIPRIAKSTSIYTKIFVTDPDDVQAWRHNGVKNVDLLPWGTDVWENFEERMTAASTKTTDLVRVGRQPTAWDNDKHTATLAESRSLSFEGRPGFGSSVDSSVQLLHEAFARAKAVLAFSVRVSPAPYTHPTKDYVTARWLDALAWGCLVVGKRPQSAGADVLLWEGATADITPDDAEQGMAEVAAALKSYSKDTAERHVRLALENLDWRHRFKELFKAIGHSSQQLDDELALMKQAYLTPGKE